MNIPRPFVNSAELLPQGALRQIYRLLLRPLVERACGFHALNAIYARLQGPYMTPQRFCEEGLQHLGVEVARPTDDELGPLRDWNGPLVVMANHPFGGAEALAMMLLLERIRPSGWRMFANRVLASTPELAPHLIAVDPFARFQSANRQGIKQAQRFLADGGVLGAFPAGRVSGWSVAYDCVLDTPWSDHPARLAAATGAAVVLLQVPGCNNGLFLKVPMCWPRLRALFLPRQMLRSNKPAMRFHIGPVMDPATAGSLVRAGNAGAKFHARCQLLAELQNEPPTSNVSAVPDIAPAGDPIGLREEVDGLSSGAALLFEQGRFTALLFQKAEASNLFHELSRLREITFRASGQGGGAAVDITPEDNYYHQLVLWDRERQRLVGAYRLGFTEEVLRERGQEALYSSHVFHMRPEFFQRIGPGIELTRSCIHPDYQRDPLALALLWRGLGKIVAARPQIRCLFGSVTVPATLSDASRAILVEHLRRHHSDVAELLPLVVPKQSFQPPGIAHRLIAEAHRNDPIETLRDTIRSADGTPRSIPPLIRHYLSMNARFLAYHVEQDFGNALYCLLRVDLSKAPPAHLNRFVGREAAAALLRKKTP